MAEYSRREVHTTRVEFIVPAPWPKGACWVELQKAISAAIVELRDSGRLGPDETPSDDTIWVRPGDTDVVVAYEVEEAFAERAASREVSDG